MILLCQWRQQFLITLNSSSSLLGDSVRVLKLRIEESRNKFTRQIGRSNIDPGIFINHATEKLTAVCTFFTNDLGTLDQSSVVYKQCAAFPRDNVFGLVETDTSQMANAAKLSTIPFRTQRLCSIFD